MSHHRQPNKPRSLHRQLSGRNSSTTTGVATHMPLPPGLEHSLNEWFNRSSNGSSNNSVSSGKSGDPVFDGIENGNHLTQSPVTAITTARLSTDSSALSSEPPPSPPPQPRPSVSVPATMHVNQPTQSSPQSDCPCCQSVHCRSWKKLSKVIRNLETETRLAAEIGQSLLQKNEAYLVESNHLKEQLKQCEDRKQEMEISLDDTERLAQKLKHEKDKWMWQYEKSEKILNESVVDLENTNLRYAALATDLEQTKLELLKYKSYQSSSREEELQSKLEDTKQELVISRKTELTLESKYKKLLARYESLLLTYQDLCKNSLIKKTNNKKAHTLLSATPPTVVNTQQASVGELDTIIEELLSTNSALKSKLLNTSMLTDDTRNEMYFIKGRHHGISQSNEELAENEIGRSIDGKLRTTITDVDDKNLSEGQSGMSSDGPRQHHAPSPSQLSSTSENAAPIPQATVSSPVVHHHYHYYLHRRERNDSNNRPHSGANKDNIVSAYCEDQNCLDSALTENTPIPRTSAQSGTFSLHVDTNITNTGHYEAHSHEEMAEQKQPSSLNNTNKNQQPRHHDNNPSVVQSVHRIMKSDTASCDDFDKSMLTTSPSISAPLPTKTMTTKDRNHSIPNEPFMSPTSKRRLSDSSTTIKSTPYSSLLSKAKSVLQRLRSTDTRILNRRLQRAFDIEELSNMSNAIIQNIIADVDSMDARFFWLMTDENVTDGGICNGSNEIYQTSLGFSCSPFLVNEFFPFVQLLQELLQEIGQLFITINQLQVAYVKKVEENETRVEKEIISKYQFHSQVSNMHGSLNKNSSNSDIAPSTSISTPLSNSSSGISSTEHTYVNPVHWLSALFAFDTDNKISATQPAIVSTSNDYNTTTIAVETLIRADEEGSKIAKSRQKRRNNHPAPGIQKRPDYHCQLPHLQQWRRPDSFTENQNHKQPAPTISSIMGEWTQATIKHSFSSSLDREWLLGSY